MPRRCGPWLSRHARQNRHAAALRSKIAPAGQAALRPGAPAPAPAPGRAPLLLLPEGGAGEAVRFAPQLPRELGLPTAGAVAEATSLCAEEEEEGPWIRPPSAGAARRALIPAAPGGWAAAAREAAAAPPLARGFGPIFERSGPIFERSGPIFERSEASTPDGAAEKHRCPYAPGDAPPASFLAPAALNQDEARAPEAAPAQHRATAAAAASAPWDADGSSGPRAAETGWADASGGDSAPTAFGGNGTTFGGNGGVRGTLVCSGGSSWVGPASEPDTSAARSPRGGVGGPAPPPAGAAGADGDAASSRSDAFSDLFTDVPLDEPALAEGAGPRRDWSAASDATRGWLASGGWARARSPGGVQPAQGSFRTLQGSFRTLVGTIAEVHTKPAHKASASPPPAALAAPAHLPARVAPSAALTPGAARAGAGAQHLAPPLPPPPVLTGHVSSLPPY